MLTERSYITHNGPYVEFPTNPRDINIGGVDLHLYVTPVEMDTYLNGMFERVVVPDDVTCLVNMEGGDNVFARFLEYRLSINRPLADSQILRVEYHRGPGESVIKTRAVPEEIKDGRPLLIVDDVWDRGNTIEGILNDLSPAVPVMVGVKKRGIPNQVELPNTSFAVELDGTKWLASTGMNAGRDGEFDIIVEMMIRSFRGITARKEVGFVA